MRRFSLDSLLVMYANFTRMGHLDKYFRPFFTRRRPAMPPFIRYVLDIFPRCVGGVFHDTHPSEINVEKFSLPKNETSVKSYVN